MRRILALSLYLLSVVTLSAHHTVAGVYDPEHRATLTGVVNNVEWKQPHVIVHLDVKDENNKMVAWAVETQTPLVLQSHGLQTGQLKPGITITTTVCVARDGSHRGYAQNIVVPEAGEIISFGCNSSRSTP